VDLGNLYRIYDFTYLNRQDGENGRIKSYELYISEDNVDWGEPVSTGEFVNTAAPQALEFPEGIVGRYWRMVGLSEVNGNPWASAAEFSMVGCTDIFFGTDSRNEPGKLSAFPVPTNGIVNIPSPPGENLRYSVISASGQVVQNGIIDQPGDIISFDISGEKPGIYFIRLLDERETAYFTKVILSH
jgi:hypothetical protein